MSLIVPSNIFSSLFASVLGCITVCFNEFIAISKTSSVSSKLADKDFLILVWGHNLVNFKFCTATNSTK